MNESTNKKQNWDVRETELLLEILKDLDIKNCLDGRKVRNNKLFKAAHRRMTAAGYHRTVDQLKFRWKLLKSAYYKRQREPSKIQGWWRYEKTMVAIMESRHSLVGGGVMTSDRTDEVTEDSDGEASMLPWPQPRTDASSPSLDVIVGMMSSILAQSCHEDSHVFTFTIWKQGSLRGMRVGAQEHLKDLSLFASFKPAAKSGQQRSHRSNNMRIFVVRVKSIFLNPEMNIF